MTPDEFMEAIVTYKRAGAIRSTLENLKEPPGRKPYPEAVELSNWWHTLSQENQSRVSDVITSAVDMALFSFFTLIDGESFIEDSPDKGEFELYYVKRDARVRLNEERGEMLHDLYNWYSRDRYREQHNS